MKRILTILLTVIMLGSLSVNCVTADETKDITVTLDGISRCKTVYLQRENACSYTICQ